MFNIKDQVMMSGDFITASAKTIRYFARPRIKVGVGWHLRTKV